MKLTFGSDSSAILKGSILERELELLLFECWEAVHDHLGVGVDDAVQAETGSLDGVLVHFMIISLLF